MLSRRSKAIRARVAERLRQVCVQGSSKGFFNKHEIALDSSHSHMPHVYTVCLAGSYYIPTPEILSSEMLASMTSTSTSTHGTGPAVSLWALWSTGRAEMLSRGLLAYCWAFEISHSSVMRPLNLQSMKASKAADYGLEGEACLIVFQVVYGT